MKIEIDGLNINYKITGEGSETAVMLQGWGTGMEIYDSVANALNDRFRFIQFDLPGFGGSDEPKEPWNVDAYADFFCRLMEKLGVERAVLIGHSYGGRVIIKLAARDSIPFEISKIVLMDAAGIMPKRSFWAKLKIKRYKILKKVSASRVVYALFPELVDDWRSRQGSADYRNASPMMRSCMVMAVNEDLTELLSKIRQETLLIWGDADTATPIGDAHIMEERIPNVGLAVLKGAGHYAFLEQPSVFREIIRSFLIR